MSDLVSSLWAGELGDQAPSLSSRADVPTCQLFHSFQLLLKALPQRKESRETRLFETKNPWSDKALLSLDIQHDLAINTQGCSAKRLKLPIKTCILDKIPMAEQSSGQKINAYYFHSDQPQLLKKSNFSYQHKQQMFSYPYLKSQSM